jgi:Transmembrane domain of unknown function (DUF3566)
MPADTPGITADSPGGNSGGGQGPDDPDATVEPSSPGASPSSGDGGPAGNADPTHGGNGAQANGGGRAPTASTPGAPQTSSSPTPSPTPGGDGRDAGPAPASGGAGFPSGPASGLRPDPAGPGAAPTPQPGQVPPAVAPGGGLPLGDPAARSGAVRGPGMPPAMAVPAAPAAPSDIPAPPVLAPPGGLHRRARHVTAPRATRSARRGLRVTQRLWSIDPWSVFKISVLFYLCVGLIVLVAGTLLYNVGRSVGTIDQIEGFVTRMGAYGTCTPKAKLPAGTEFETDEDCGDGEVLVGGFTIDDGTLFRAAAIGGAILVVAGSIGNVLLTVLINLLNELTGGLRHTIVREPVARQPQSRGSPPRAPQR